MSKLPNGNVSQVSKEEKSGKKGKGMYSVKKPYEIPQNVQLPDCMYQVQPINNQQVGVSESNHDLKGSISRGTLTVSEAAANAGSVKRTASCSSTSMDTIDSLVLRQLNIIDKLTSLKEMINSIHEKCVGAGNTAVSFGNSSLAGTDTFDQQVMPDDNVDIVVNANPDKPPYTLIFFAHLLENSYSNAVVSYSSHVHSSYRGNVSQELMKTFSKEGASTSNVNFTIVWKDVNASTMVVTPVQGSPIELESNIARFLSRLLPLGGSNLNYDCLSWETLVKVDRFLDQANDSKVISLIDNELKKSKQSFLAGELTVADLVLYSSVLSKMKGTGLPPTLNVSNWIKRIEASFGVWISGLSSG